MRILNTSFAYLFWLANNKKVKYPEFYMGYIDGTWYVGIDGHYYYTKSGPRCIFCDYSEF